MRWIVAGLAMAGITLGSGCVSQGRWEDLQDCGLASVGVGWGLSGNVKLGVIGHLSAGLPTRTVRVGHESRDVSGIWTEEELPAAGWRDRPEHSPYVSYVRANCSQAHATMPLEVGRWLNLAAPDFKASFHQMDDIQVGLTLGVLSARVGINRLETLDLLLGFVGLDIAGDDTPPSKTATPPPAPVGPIRYVLDDGTVVVEAG